MNSLVHFRNKNILNFPDGGRGESHLCQMILDFLSPNIVRQYQRRYLYRLVQRVICRHDHVVKCYWISDFAHALPLPIVPPIDAEIDRLRLLVFASVASRPNARRRNSVKCIRGDQATTGRASVLLPVCLHTIGQPAVSTTTDPRASRLYACT